MKNSGDPAKALQALLKKIEPVEAPELPTGDDPLGSLVLSFLMWESTTDKASAAYARLMDGIVDFNDLRVSMPHETVELIGERYPMATDRAERIRACLRDIYMREHGVTLDRLVDCGKRDIRKYIDSLEGIVPYVGARVLQVAFGTHAMPVDEQLRSRLIEEGAADEEMDVGELSQWLTRQVKASAGLRTHYALQAWVETTRSKGTKKKSGAKKTKKSPTSRRKTSKKKKTSKTR